MPTKTDRILSYLPLTFKTSPRPAVLYPLADAFGNELLLGENSLAAIMLAHWVDFADKNAAQIDDLAKLAALYGLAPWRDQSGESLESVEEFREHLKRYVRTFLEGTVTVQGILRVSAEALALRIADEPKQLDRWWTRGQDAVVTQEALGNDAAAQLNFDRPISSGSPALPAQVKGSVDLSEGINLQGTNILRLKFADSVEEIDLTKAIAPDATLALKQIVDIINEPPRRTIASHDGRYLKLESPEIGSSSKLEIINGPNDAAPRLLGLAPMSYHGSQATAAQYAGTTDLSSPIDLSDERYLRLEIDGKHLAEIDCAGGDPAKTTLQQIRDKINNAFPGLNVASDDGKHLLLTSPTQGLGSSVSAQPPAAQSAASKILGVPSFFVAGQDAQAARADSTRDLRGTIDLSQRANIRLRIDGGGPVTINCAGVDPNKTERVEIVAAINAALNQPAANITERSISVSSLTTGPASELVFEQPPDDATSDIFGIGPLSFQGSDATAARLTATPLLTNNGLDVRANNFLLLAVDGSTPIEIDLSGAARNLTELESLPLQRLTEHINKSFAGAQIASTDGKHLFLVSTRSGGVSQLEVLPRETMRKRRFVTRAIITDEAAGEIFGFFAKEAKGTAAIGAGLTGTTDLGPSVDLRETRFLRLQVDGFSPLEIDCAASRPRATTLTEVVSQINNALQTHGLTKSVATDDGKHLVLTSPSAGASSRLVIEPPQVALDRLLRVEPGTFLGAPPAAVKFTGTVNLIPGIDLPINATIKLAIDDAESREIVLGEAAPVHRSVSDITNAINTAFQGPVASTDGRRIELRSAKTGTSSKIRFDAPTANDVTKEVFGIAAPREYHGAEATRARVVGQKDLSGTTDLSVFSSLQIAIDGAPSQTIDCGAKAAQREAATLAEIVNSIGADIASSSPDGKHLILTSREAGPTAQITLEPFTAGDASKALFGSSPLSETGTAASAAVIAGEKSLLSSINLRRRSVLRIAVDGGRPVDIDVAGAVPAQTALDEIVAQINRIFPNLAAANAEDQLQLTAPATGPESSLSLLPLRFLEVMEYPPRAVRQTEVEKKHNGSWDIDNNGVTDSYAEITITAPQGTVGPTLVNTGLGWSVHLFIVLERGETVRLFSDPRRGFQAEVISADSKTRSVAGSQIQLGPLGIQAQVPFETTWTLSGQQPSLQLNNPQARSIVVLNGLKPGNKVNVDVRESDPDPFQPPAIKADAKLLVGRIKAYNEGFQLVDNDETSIAELLAGPHIDLETYLDKVVRVEGLVHANTPPSMLVERIAALFDVRLYSSTVVESYSRVSIGMGPTDHDSLVRQIVGGSKDVPASELVRGEELDKALVLKISPGKQVFRYLDCPGSRFNYAHFDHSNFPDGVCDERGIFNVSRFSNAPPERIKTVFASAEPFSEPPVKIDFRWEEFSAGAFVVNLPADLLPRFGGRFNEARFSQEQDSPEKYEHVVAEPVTDENFLVKRLTKPGAESKFVTATRADFVELGSTPVRMPFRKPQFLTLGGSGRAARLYLSEEGLTGFIKLEATKEGAWGNEISVSARQTGPAIYEVQIIYRGARFEQARSIVMGQVRETIKDFLQPGPTGLLQAKAAGVRADVTRERAEYDQSIFTT